MTSQELIRALDDGTWKPDIPLDREAAELRALDFLAVIELRRDLYMAAPECVRTDPAACHRWTVWAEGELRRRFPDLTQAADTIPAPGLLKAGAYANARMSLVSVQR